MGVPKNVQMDNTIKRLEIKNISWELNAFEPCWMADLCQYSLQVVKAGPAGIFGPSIKK
jgi:hypothetical protein